MNRTEKVKEDNYFDEDLDLTEEDIREGRIYTEKEFCNNFEKNMI